MDTAQWPARALGMLSSRVSINTVSQHMVSRDKHLVEKLTLSLSDSKFYEVKFSITKFHKPRFRQARVFVHFHSFSCVATLTSSITKGTHPPKTYILHIEKTRLQSDAAAKPTCSTGNSNMMKTNIQKVIARVQQFSHLFVMVVAE